MEDGVDYVPTDSKYLAGQHFSAIAAAGPVTGPVIAGMTFGWFPTLLWILIGTIFIGGVHDMGSLVASIRHKATGIADSMKNHVSNRVYILFNIFIFFTLIMIGLYAEIHENEAQCSNYYLFAIGCDFNLDWSIHTVQLARCSWASFS